MKNEKLSNEQISGLCMELSLLLHAGVRVGDGLALLAEESHGGDRAWLEEMAHQVDEGTSLAAALDGSGRFPDYVSGLLKMGERSGRTEEALRALSVYYEERSRMERRLRSALLYPAVMLLLMLAVIVILLARVLPVFDEVYASLGGQLTGVAGGLLALGRALDAAMPVLCVLLGLIVVFLAAFAAVSSFREQIMTLWRRTLGDKGISRMMQTARFAQALSMGLSSGLPLEEALTLAGQLQKDIPAARARCQDCLDRLERGEDLASALNGSGVLPKASCRLVALGQRSGTGDTVMEEVARRLSEESEYALETRVGQVEPALVLVTSLLVGAILLSVMLPLMNIMTAIG
ncbi:type II secretion system F family protein [uncultured Oscillibacter sp.]|uniref:type II secretion system F family protein n=1 Tax=uncultured Oscillibacter sp. TaxID=876091 RepID=UPI00280B4B0D|nr:type II secretion system F family protein [uncultured Oscillibacter sp.]